MKDPAFLFYPEAFLSGVSDLTMEERGQYITMLCLQHAKGRLSEKTIRLSVGLISVDVRLKFRLDENGFLYNERLEKETLKRENFANSRRENGKKGGRPSVKSIENQIVINDNNNEINDNAEKTTRFSVGYPKDNLPININRNINKDIIKEKKGEKNQKKITPPELVEFMNYAKIYCDAESLGFEQKRRAIEAKYNSWIDAGWKDGHGKQIQNWKTKFQNAVGYLANDKNLKPQINGNQTFATNRPPIAN